MTPGIMFDSIPASALLMQLLQAQHQNTGSMSYGITLIPTFSVGVDIMGIGVVLVSIMGLLGVARGCRQLMNFYFVLVLLFIGVQVGNAVVGFLSGSNWIKEALETSWSRAYKVDKGLIQDLQNEFHCQGFHSQEDRSTSMSLRADVYLPPCAEILHTRFGQRLQRLATIILCIRLIQLTGVFLLCILFKHLATTDQAEEAKETGVESSYFKNEKQIEDEDAKVPLLDEEDKNLPYYTARSNIYGDEVSDEDEDYDEEQKYGGMGKSVDDNEFHGLPEYAEDEIETQVYVA
ncbi:hypothetical protein BGZ49_008035 [Haplosporangium sp. Z 27]|nr:hypothetical protein BGZ49_008035 [Haplosporangium sp. Z 27]